MARKKLCICGKLIDYHMNYCKDCTIAKAEERAQYHRHYDRHTRDADSATFYNSYEWLRIRQYVLSQYKGLDIYALLVDKEIVHADTVHHIIELREDWDRRIEVSNLLPLSSGNHSKIHKLYKKNKKETQKLLFNLMVEYKKLYG